MLGGTHFEHCRWVHCTWRVSRAHPSWRGTSEHQNANTKRLSVGYWTNRYWSVLFHLTICAWDIFDIQKDADYAYVYVSQANVLPIDLELFCCRALSTDHDRDDLAMIADERRILQPLNRSKHLQWVKVMGPWDHGTIQSINSQNPTESESHEPSVFFSSSWTNIMFSAFRRRILAENLAWFPLF